MAVVLCSACSLSGELGGWGLFGRKLLHWINYIFIRADSQTWLLPQPHSLGMIASTRCFLRLTSSGEGVTYHLFVRV